MIVDFKNNTASANGRYIWARNHVHQLLSYKHPGFVNITSGVFVFYSSSKESKESTILDSAILCDKQASLEWALMGGSVIASRRGGL